MNRKKARNFSSTCLRWKVEKFSKLEMRLNLLWSQTREPGNTLLAVSGSSGKYSPLSVKHYYLFAYPKWIIY